MSIIQHFFPGTVYLEEKTRPSQHLSTSSDVSFKSEVEDLRLFEDRKRGPSQLFNSLEISPSGMQADPQCKKIVDNGDGPNICHDSSGVGIWMALLASTSLTTIVTFPDEDGLGNEGHSSDVCFRSLGTTLWTRKLCLPI